MSKKTKFWIFGIGFVVLLWFMSPEPEEAPKGLFDMPEGDGSYTEETPEVKKPKRTVKSYTPPPSRMYAGEAAKDIVRSGAIPGLVIKEDLFAREKTAADLANGQPARFRLAKIRLKTRRGIMPMVVGLADTEELQERGMMFYRKWPSQMHGLLFLFSYAQSTSFWMKNTYIPLDIIFISPEGKVINIAANVQPLSEKSVLSNGITKAVLEVPAGAAAKWQINVGDTLIYGDYGKEQ